jgi:serine/threonine protein kinase
MTPERWKQISRIYEGARLRDGSDRIAFLTEACAGDASLQREVQALIDQPTSPEGLERLTPSAIAHAMANDDSGGLTGRRFGVYLVRERIGVGGMGEVYRASDTRLGRDVAIKVLPQAFATDPDRLARFEREARVLASLDHPHIGTILGVEERDGVRALVLGLVEGDTLAERIARGPIPLADALEYARQIADALEAAHEKGVIHRDLKPSNVKITSTGVVKVLDFGLAKAEPLSSSEGLAAAVTATSSGVVLGTVAYMSPEQARGHAVDKRADIWAFGCVFFEMLTGRDAFAGLTPSDTVAAILERDPDLRALPTTTPPSVERLLKRCFEKDPKRRLRDIGEARVDIDDAQHFATNEGEGRLWRVPVVGGRPETLTRPDSKDGKRHSLPHMLPDGRGVLYTIGSPSSNFADGQVAVMSLATGETHVVLDHGVDARYVPSGHLVYMRDGTLMAVPFDLRGLRVTGAPAAIVKGVMQAVRAGSLSVSETGAAQFSVSNAGVLVYVPSAPVPESPASLVWVGRNGTETYDRASRTVWGGTPFAGRQANSDVHAESRDIDPRSCPRRADASGACHLVDLYAGWKDHDPRAVGLRFDVD